MHRTGRRAGCRALNAACHPDRGERMRECKRTCAAGVPTRSRGALLLPRVSFRMFCTLTGKAWRRSIAASNSCTNSGLSVFIQSTVQRRGTAQQTLR